MPNWCNNNIELAHDDPAMIERAAAAFRDGKFLNEFIPLPKNWKTPRRLLVRPTKH